MKGNMECNIISQFFDSLSERLYKEIYLSDITYAMCNSCSLFKDKFLRFFFDNIPIDKPIIIEREISRKGSRPDFVVTVNKDIYIIENKIYDRNLHIEQYIEDFKIEKERMGIISNYVIEENTLTKNHTWKDFYNYIKEDSDFSTEEKTLVNAYCKYLKKVCSINDFTKVMKFNDIYSLYVFNELLKEICSLNTDDYITEPYNQLQKCDGGYENGISGSTFKITYKKGCLPISYGWIGLYYNKEIPEIYIGFYNHVAYAKTICNLFDNNDLPTSNYFDDKPFSEGSYWWIKLSTCKYEEIQQANTVEAQKDILKSFLEKVIDLTIKLKAKDKDGTNI